MRERSVAAIRQQADAPIDAGRREDARRRARRSSLAVASGAMSGIVKLNSVSHSNSRVRSSLPSAPVASTVNM